MENSLGSEIDAMYREQIAELKAQLNEGTGYLEEKVRELEKKNAELVDRLCSCGGPHYCESEIVTAKAEAFEEAAKIVEASKPKCHNADHSVFCTGCDLMRSAVEQVADALSAKAKALREGEGAK